VIFTEAKLGGAWIIEPERIADARGFFARTFCRQAFEERGMAPAVAQCSVSFNHTAGTLRGMHYQAPPHGECKLVRCTMGAIYDVILDLRVESPTFRQWQAVELSAENRWLVYIPEGLAHGFQTLRDGTEVLYQISASHHGGSARGVRWDDPAFEIAWPQAVTVISDRDRDYSDFA